jgi:hypothetical protein
VHPSIELPTFADLLQLPHPNSELVCLLNMESPDELEVVKISPSTALDRALLKEKKKKKQQEQKEKQEQQLNRTKYQRVVAEATSAPKQGSQDSSEYDAETSKTNSKGAFGPDVEALPESMGQELLWVEDATMASSPSPVKTQKKRGLFSRLKSKPVSPEKIKKKKKKESRVVLLNAPPSGQQPSSDRIKKAAAKAQHARALLDQALVENVDAQQRDEILKNAFTEAAEARRLVDPESAGLEQTKLLVEKEALEASRILLTMSTFTRREEKKEERELKVDTAAAALAATLSPHTPLTLMRSANEHAEAARRYLESMLPEFFDGAVSDDEDGTNYDIDEDQEEDEEEDREYTDEERKRRAEEKQATISRVVQQNNTFSTLGFDNTYRDEVLTIDSLNAFLDAPFSMDGDTSNKSDRNKVVIEGKDATDMKLAAEWREAKEAKEVRRKKDVEAQAAAAAASPIKAPPAAATEPKKSRSKLSHFGRSRSKRAAAKATGVAAAAGTAAVVVSSKKKSADNKYTKVNKFIATVVPEDKHELPVPDEHELQHLSQVQAVTRVTSKRLEEAAEDDASVVSYDGVPRHQGYTNPNATPPRVKSRNMNTQFIAAPKIANPALLSARSWEDLADGTASLQEVIDDWPEEEEGALPQILSISKERSTEGCTKSKSKRFKLFGRKKSKKTLNADKEASAEVSKSEVHPIPQSIAHDGGYGHITNSTNTQSEDFGDDPHNISIMTEDSYLRDRYAVMDEFEGAAHEAVKKRLTQRKPILSDVDMMPAQPSISTLLRQAFTWGDDDEDVDNAKAGKPIHDADENDINTARRSAKPSDGDVKMPRAATANNYTIQASNSSFMEKMDAALEEHAQKKAERATQAEEEQKPQQPEKKGLFRRFKKQASVKT